MRDVFKLDEPLNMEERYLYGINARLSILIEQMSSLLEHIATKDNVAVQDTVEKLETVIDVTNDIIEKKEVVKRTRNKNTSK